MQKQPVPPVGAGLSERGDASLISITWDLSGQEAPSRRAPADLDFL